MDTHTHPGELSDIQRRFIREEVEAGRTRPSLYPTIAQRAYAIQVRLSQETGLADWRATCDWLDS